MFRRTSGNGEKGAGVQSVKGRKPEMSGDRIGDILLSEGTISREQLDLALTMQRNDPRRLGEILLSLGYVTAADLARALAQHMKLEYVVISELSDEEVDSKALDLLDEQTLRKYMVLPLRFEERRLIVAVADPTNLYALEDLRMMTNHPIRAVAVTEEDLEDAYTRLFGAGEDGPETEEESTAPSEGSDGGTTGDTTGRDVEEDGAPKETTRRARAGTISGRIGDILVSEGTITPEQLQEGLALQREDRREIGKILLSLGYVKEVDLARALAKRLRLDYVELNEKDVDRGAASLVDQKVLRRHGAIPMRVENGRLIVAMTDPNNFYALEDLRMISGYPVTPVVALESEIRQIQNKVFAISQEVTDLLEDTGDQGVLDDVGEVELGDGSADNAPVVRLVSSILQQAVGEGASDIHVEPRARELTIRVRVDGVLREIMSVPPKLQNGVIARLKILASLNIAERRIPQDGRFSVRLGDQKVDLRVATLPTVFGEKVVLRLLNTASVDVNLAGLGFAPEVLATYREIFGRPYGTVLVTGPTGSGKSTTLYATLEELNTPQKNIITVEDPVEYRMRGINQIQVNARIGLTFPSGLRSILRADPDVVMIGEIRDHETAKTSVEAALTGHLVLATLHTNDAPAAVTRLVEMGVEPFLVSSAVDCVIAQRLARRLCERCKRPCEVDEGTLGELGFPFSRYGEGGRDFHEAVGCDRCGGTGFRGRIGIYEMMFLDEEIRRLILRGASADAIGRAAQKAGTIPLKHDGLMKAALGITTVEEILLTIV
jgi:type IV pilus assembly protein PilB